MDARLTRVALVATLLIVSMGAKHRTPNFIVETADPQMAVKLAETAERCRHDLAIAWLGHTLPNWTQPCPMTVQVGPKLGAGGATSFVFDHGEVFNWRMTIQGSAERLLDSVVPHEVTHMILASHFRQPLPRWADEGAATSVECVAERYNHRKMLCQFLQTGRGIAFSQMFAMKDYPADIMPLYAQGYSLCDYLIQLRGRREFVRFLDDALASDDWRATIQKHYGMATLGMLQSTWLAWVQQGSPQLKPAAPAGPGAAPRGEEFVATPAAPPPAAASSSVYALARQRALAARSASSTGGGWTAPAATSASPSGSTVAAADPARPLAAIQWPAEAPPPRSAPSSAALPASYLASVNAGNANQPAANQPAANAGDDTALPDSGWKAPSQLGNYAAVPAAGTDAAHGGRAQVACPQQPTLGTLIPAR